MRCCLAVVILQFSAAFALASDTAAAHPPNILFIAVDDLNCALGCYGDVLARTPNIDRLAASGVRFDRAYNQIPLCNPSRASLMTGLRPDRTRVYDLVRHFRDELPNVVTLPQAFRNAGYYAARVGKIYHYNVPDGIGTDGLDDAASWDEVHNPRGRDLADAEQIFNAEPHRPVSAALSWLAAEGSDAEQTDGLIATQAIDILRERGSKPLFLAVGFFRPHTPYVAPQKYFDMYPPGGMRLPYAPPGDRDDIPVAAFAHNCPVPNYGLDEEVLLQATQAYYACVSFVDAQVGRLLDALEELGQADNTIVVLWSDHGYHLGEHHGVWQKRTLFEQGARAPLIIRVPGASGNGQACRRVVELLDIYPTLAALAGIVAPAELDGRSLVPLLQQPAAEWRGQAITQILRPADSRLPQPVMGCSIRTERYRYSEWGNGEYGVELYDHHTDPGEFHNLAIEPGAAAQAVIDRLRPLLREKACGEVPSTPFTPERL